MADNNLDYNIGRKSEETKEEIIFKSGIPIPRYIEFNIWGACNRSCPFCPVSNPKVYENRHEGILLSDYEKCMKDLSEIEYSGGIIFSAFSEPFLNKELNELIKITRKYLQNSSIEINSNGDVIKSKQNLVDQVFSNGLNKLIISIYDGEDSFLEFESLFLETEYDITLRRRYLKDGNYGMVTSNRAGSIDTSKYQTEDQKKKQLDLPLKQPCYYPFYMLLIDYNGDVLLCAHDWEKKLIGGNAFKENIFDIWNGENFNFARNKLKDSNRGFEPCNKCNVDGTLIGEKYYKSF